MAGHGLYGLLGLEGSGHRKGPGPRSGFKSPAAYLAVRTVTCKERNLDSGNLCPLETTVLTARKPIIERHKSGVGVFTCIPSTAVAGTGGSIPTAHKSTKRFSEMRWDPVSKNKID